MQGERPSSARSGIVTAGTWCVDGNKLVEYWPGEDGLAEILNEEARGGGSGCNLAIDIKRLDPDIWVETQGLIGEDEDGRLLHAEADRYGIDRRRLVMTREARTLHTDAYTSQRSGRRTHIFNPGAASLMTPDHFDFTDTKGRILHLGLPGVHKKMDAPWNGDANGWLTVLRMARQAGLITNLELATASPARLRELVRPMLPHLDLLIVNDSEMGAIGEEETVRDDRTVVEACIRAARKVLEAGSCQVVAAHFPTGAVAVTRGGDIVTQPSIRVPKSVIAGANGAGDAFAAGFLYGFHEGWELRRCLALAHAAAAASLRSVTTCDAVAPWRECLALADEWGWNDGIG
ncbi:carbohydrate kinase family protein [Labrys sp. LIt4]|uniref:carbohydrate kinase family protein n=1 Tax=Labrys sp. LIt4 TaxID=2821355 RepID=UPI001ADF4077|nr:PfkB family carbohydrate kinase [Labrys sp. LIt4]MBP0581580.1 carbohydrate kinase family protein [Labrys sp. LIt4]